VDDSGKLIKSKVTKKFSNGRSNDWYKVTVLTKERGNSYNKIVCTGKHRFFSLDKGSYIALENMNVGDKIMKKNREFEPNFIQKEVLKGKMLGDGFYGNRAVSFGHCEEQQEYLNYTLHMLGFFAGNLQKEYISGYGSKIVRARSISSKFIEKMFEKWLVQGNKTIPKNLFLSPISLAFFYMDDGSISNIDCMKQNYRTHFAVCGFDYDSVTNIKNALEKIGIFSTITGEKNRLRIHLNNKNSFKLFSIIYPYVCKSMEYKLPEEFRLNNVKFSNFNLDCFENNLYESEILKIEKIDVNYKRYDIETETHNYFANDVLVHNSNFSIISDGNKTVCAKRSGFLQDDENFYGFQEVMSRYLKVFDTLIELASDLNEQVQLYGELFGGNIQKGVYYGEQKQFRWYALRIGSQLVSGEYRDELLQDILEYKVPVIWKKRMKDTETFVDFLNNFDPNNLQSILTPQGFRNTNTMEGFVIAPYDRVLQTPVGEYILIKNKSKAFLENKSTPKRKSPPKEMTKEAQEAYDRLSTMVNDNRTYSLFSKEGELEDIKFLSQYASMYFSDVMIDYNKEYVGEWSNLSKSEQKDVKKKLSQDIFIELKEKL
jgi:Rnl2 family RNA ligase